MGDDSLQVRKAGAAAVVEPGQEPGADGVDELVARTLAQLRSTLDSSQVVGEPIVLGDTTVIPLLSVGMGFGAGRGDAKVTGQNGGRIGIGAGGGGVKPIAMVIAGPDGVRIEPVGIVGAVDRLAAVVEEKFGSQSDDKK